MAEQLGTSDAIGGASSEATDVPIPSGQKIGGIIGSADAGYKQGGKVDLKDCKVSTHLKNKSSPNW